MQPKIIGTYSYVRNPQHSPKRTRDWILICLHSVAPIRNVVYVFTALVATRSGRKDAEGEACRLERPSSGQADEIRDRRSCVPLSRCWPYRGVTFDTSIGSAAGSAAGNQRLCYKELVASKAHSTGCNSTPPPLHVRP